MNITWNDLQESSEYSRYGIHINAGLSGDCVGIGIWPNDNQSIRHLTLDLSINEATTLATQLILIVTEYHKKHRPQLTVEGPFYD